MEEQAHTADPLVWPTFQDFYDAYGKKVGRVNAEKQWAKLKQKDKEALMQHVPLYVKSREKKYRKDPERYLKHRTWEDELITGKEEAGVAGARSSADEKKRAVLINILGKQGGQEPYH